jgi:hypothetical protein
MSRNLLPPLVLVACTNAPTRVTVDVTADPAWQLDGYELGIAGRTAQTEAVGRLELEIPDAAAGHANELRVWGLVAGARIAYGTTTVAPVRHEDVAVSLVLAPLACDTACNDGDAACNGEATTTCSLGDDGCPHWSAPVPCPADAPYCSNGACSATCMNECVGAGLTICDGLGVRACVPSQTDTCLHWTLPTPCMAPDHGVAICATTSCGFTCDSGYEAEGASCVRSSHVVFVTSGQYNGDLGDVGGADAICQQLAGAAGLPGTFAAWLSSVGSSATDRLHHSDKPYVRRDGTVVATSWDDLTDGQLAAPISIDENGITQSGNVWTSTSFGGEVAVADTRATCIEWTSAMSSVFDGAFVGSATATDGTWTLIANAVVECGQAARLYCVEQ